MKRYNHTNIIFLKKKNVQYISKITGAILLSTAIQKYKDTITKIFYITYKGCKIPLTIEEFNNEFIIFIPREEELKNETLKFNDNRLHNIYTHDIVSGPGFNTAKVSNNEINNIHIEIQTLIKTKI